MNNENTSIHEFDFSLICEYFSSIERQGPGSVPATLKALSFIDNLNSDSKLADIGCGTGGQTITLAENCPANITAIDLFPTFIEKLTIIAEMHNLQTRIKGVVGSMESLEFKEEELDVIWSEGAIYNIGFERGLKEWRKFLKKGGYIAVTEASWFTDERPEEIEKFWIEAYPLIDTIPNQIALLQKAGYVFISAFSLPEECWTKNFYDKQQEASEIFLKKYAGNKTAERLIEYEKLGAVNYSKYKEYYGYVFFIGKKI